MLRRKDMNAKAQRRKDAKESLLVMDTHAHCKSGDVFAPSRLCIFALMLFFSLSACVPAETPPILHATPAPPIRVIDQRVITSAFSITYPFEWRAILSPAGEPPFVTAAAPDNCTAIIISIEPVEPPTLNGDCGETVIRTSQSLLNSGTIYLSGVSSDADLLQTTLAQIQESITAP